LNGAEEREEEEEEEEEEEDEEGELEDPSPITASSAICARRNGEREEGGEENASGFCWLALKKQKSWKINALTLPQFMVINK